MTDAKHGTKDRQAGRALRLGISAVALVLFLWFIIGNAQKVQIHFWVTSAQASLIAVILISAAFGAILALLLSRGRKSSKR
jgi:uncharacterized integral membrane protein